MSALDDAKVAAEALASQIKGLQSDAKASGGKLTQIEERMTAFEAAQQKVAQAVDAANRERFDRTTSGVGDRALGRYTRCAESDVQSSENSRCYMKGKTGSQHAVRLVGHDRLGDPSQPQSRYRVWGLFDDPEPRTDWQRRAQQLVDSRNLRQNYLNVGRDAQLPKLRAWSAEAELLDHMRSGPDEIARIFADSSGIGADWIPDTPFPELERQIMFRPSRWQIFQQVQMTRNPLYRPLRSGFLRPYKGAVPLVDDPSADPLSSFTTSSQVIEAIEMVVGAQIHMNADEDSLIAWEPEIRTDLVDAHVFGIENAITNGDTAASHQDAIALWDTRLRLGGTAGLGGANDHRRSWDGHRRISRQLTAMTTDGATAAVTFAHIMSDLNTVAPESLLSSDGRVSVVIEVSPETFFGTIVNLAEFDAFDNVGLLASVLTGQIGDVSRTPGGLLPGQVGFIQGRFPVLVNYLLTKDLAATGLYTGSGATSTKLTYAADRFQMFILKGQMVKMAEDIRNNTRTLVSRQRLVFKAKDAVSSTNKTVHSRYNIP